MSTDVIPPWPIFERALQQGRLTYQFCSACQLAIYYPRTLCPGCGRTGSIDWRESSGAGVLYSKTRIHSRRGDHIVALIDLDEGFRMMSTLPLEEEPDIGERVKAVLPREAQLGDVYFVAEEGA